MSDRHPSDLLSLSSDGAGLLLTPCPGTRGPSPDGALAQLQEVGAEAVITLMPAAEMAANGVANLDELCARRGLHWVHCPIEDERAPGADFVAAWEERRALVHRLLDEGRKIAIHCKGGSGRTGLMAAHILLERGWSGEKASGAVKALRPNALTLPVHQDYFAALARR